MDHELSHENSRAEGKNQIFLFGDFRIISTDIANQEIMTNGLTSYVRNSQN